MSPYRDRPDDSAPAGHEDIPIRLFNGERIILQRIGRGVAVYHGKLWVSEDGVNWWVEDGACGLVGPVARGEANV